MRRLWLLFAQTATICLAILLIITTLKPAWLAQINPKNTKRLDNFGHAPD